MKILYIAGKSNDAELAAFALQTVAPGGVVTWTASLVHARRWIGQNPQVAALIVQVEPDGPDYASFINEINAQGVKPPVIVVAGGSAPAAGPALRALAQTTLAKNPYLFNDLPSVVKRLLATPGPPAVRDEPVRPAPPKAGKVRLNPFANLPDTAEASDERVNQALAAAGRAEAALKDSEHRLAEAKLALERAESRHAGEMQDAAARLASERAHATERSSQASAALDALRAQLVDQATALQRTEQHAVTSRQAAAEEAARRQANAESELRRETANVGVLEEKIANAEAAHAAAAKRHASEVARLAERLGELERHSAEQQAEAARNREALTVELADADQNLQRAAERHAYEITSATTRLTESQQQANLLRSQLAEAEGNLQRAREQHALELAGAAERFAEVQKQAEAHFADLRAKLSQTEDRHASELAAVAARLAEAEQKASIDRQAAIDGATAQKAAFDAELARSTAQHETLTEQLAHAAAQAETQLVDANGRLRQTEERHATELVSGAARLAEAEQQAEAALSALRSQLADTTAALQRAEQQASIDRQAAIDGATAQKTAFDAKLAQSTAKHEALAQQLADTEAERQRAERNAETQLAHAARRATEQEARFTARLSEETSRREVIERELVELREASEQAQRRFLDGVTEIRERAQEHARQLEDRAAGERAGWEVTLADRQTQVGQLQREIDVARQTVSAREGEIRRLEAELDAKRAQFDQARDAADSDLVRVRQESAALQHQLDDHLRRFDAAPVSICRCDADGTIKQASRTLAKLLGYATARDLERVSLPTAVFTSADELKWLIDRCRSSRLAQSIETTWAKKDGGRIIVRLVATTTSDGGIDLAAEDITSVKSLAEKLNHAQRLEAVARYASEVAVTCENLLNDVKRSAQEWLPKVESQTIRYQCERWVADVGRATGFLRQLTLYGDKQKQATPLVAVDSVLEDLAAVLKRVAGDNITLDLPKDSKTLNLDVDSERVERIFVNVAAFARQRMPFGGRLLFEIAPALVDREFADRYANVRPGAHVLFTVTEQKSSSPSTLAAPDVPAAGTQDTPGLDLGVLQSLVADCGGHLWIAAEASGDMVLKIHLPRRMLDDHEAAKSRGRWISRLVAATAHRQLN